MNRLAGGDWDKMVRRPEDRCATCGVAFPGQADIVSVLVATPEGFLRRDHHPACLVEADPAQFSHWRWRKAPEVVTQRRLDLGFLSEFFRRLVDLPPGEQAETRWIVGLLLWRKKILELLGETPGEAGRPLLELRFRGEERTFEVQDPGIDEARAIALREDLGRLFSLEPAPAAAGDAGPPAATTKERPKGRRAGPKRPL